MRIPGPLVRSLHATLMRRVADQRPPDVVIGGDDDPYLRRWWIVARNSRANAYLHNFCRSDDDRALHDHPWRNVSVLLSGSYTEHVEQGPPRLRQAGDVVARWSPLLAHRVELPRDADGREVPCWTLFLTGPNVREWGFLCPQGWRPWREFGGTKNGVTWGKGCGE